MNALENAIFARSVAEIEAIGLRVSPESITGYEPYRVIAGRSNSRWWLIPLKNRRVAESGMAMFQPVLPVSRLIKLAGSAAARLGLASIIPGPKLYISTGSVLAEIFRAREATYAFFTGTDSPQRKTTVQVMDREGNIKGYAKLAMDHYAASLLSHEAETLVSLKGISLRTASIPSLLFHGDIGGVSVLATDSRRQRKSRSMTGWGPGHSAFVRELSERTAEPPADGEDWFADRLRSTYESSKYPLDAGSRKVVASAMAILSERGRMLGPPCMSHGDFTPWNSFAAEGGLFVFDWEHATRAYPSGYDLVYFMSSLPRGRHRNPSKRVEWLIGRLEKEALERGREDNALMLLAYFCGRLLGISGPFDRFDAGSVVQDHVRILSAAAALCTDYFRPVKAGI